MESDKIYEDSKSELLRIRRSLASSSLSINMDKFDQETRGEIIAALNGVITKRSSEIDAVILGAKMM